MIYRADGILDTELLKKEILELGAESCECTPDKTRKRELVNVIFYLNCNGKRRRCGDAIPGRIYKPKIKNAAHILSKAVKRDMYGFIKEQTGQKVEPSTMIYKSDGNLDRECLKKEILKLGAESCECTSSKKDTDLVDVFFYLNCDGKRRRCGSAVSAKIKNLENVGEMNRAFENDIFWFIEKLVTNHQLHHA